MSRIEECFRKKKQAGRKALVSFITAGDPDQATTLTLMSDLVAGGVDILELGVPFSDPGADGPVIQRACERALLKGMTLRKVLELVRDFRQIDAVTPVVLMGYLNPIEIMGYEEFICSARAAGVDGVLIVDLPPEESDEFSLLAKQHGLDQIFMLTPTSTVERIRQVNDKANGFVYYVSLKGVTGSAVPDPQLVAIKLNEIRQYCDFPLAVGFGISDAKSVAAIGKSADAVVVGSALVKLIAANPHDLPTLSSQIRAKVKTLRTALDQLDPS